MKKLLIVAIALMFSAGVAFAGGGQVQCDGIDPPDVGGDPSNWCGDNADDDAEADQPRCGSNDVNDPGCAAPGD